MYDELFAHPLVAFPQLGSAPRVVPQITEEKWALHIDLMSMVVRDVKSKSSSSGF